MCRLLKQTNYENQIFISCSIRYKLKNNSTNRQFFYRNTCYPETKTGKIFGTLCTPKKFKKIPVALIIAGSGPTDRNCNNPVGFQTDAYKILAHKLAASNIATLRYDKRGIGESKDAMVAESDLRFETYINDACGWLAMLKADKRFSEVDIIGHSEGSLIGMVAAKKNTNKYISLAGVGQTADKTLKLQLAHQSKTVQDSAFPIIDSLAAGKLVKHVPTIMVSLFRQSVQPYEVSWFKYDPSVEIKKLSIPVLILQGTSDLQVRVEDAQLLKAADASAKLILLDGMNHILRKVGDNKEANMKSYSDPSLPLDEELVSDIIGFIKGK